MTELIDPTRVAQADMARFLGVTDRTLRNLTASGVLTQVERGKYSLAETGRAYYAYIVRGKVASEHSAKRSALDDEKIRRLRIENDRDDGLTISVFEVEVACSAAMTLIASRLDALPSRHASELATMSDPGKIRHYLKDIVRGIREDAAAKFQGMGNHRAGRSAAATTAKPRAGRVGGSKPRIAAGKS